MFGPCGRHLIVGSHKSTLGIQFNVTDNGTVINPTGYEYKVLTTIATVLNFSFTLVDCTSLPYCTKTNDGKWTGLLGDVLEGKIDVAMSTLSMTPERMEIAHFSPSYFMDHVAFFIKPREMSERKGIFFIEPFTSGTWLLILVYVLSYAIILQFLLKPKLNLSGKGIFLIMANILNQGYDLNISKNFRYRVTTTIVLIFWLFTSTVISVYYGSCLTSSASFPESLTINTVNQLIPFFERGELQIGALPGSYYLERAYTLREGLKNPRLVREEYLDDLIESLIRGEVAILLAAKYFIAHMRQKGLSDQYHMVKEPLGCDNLGMALSKNLTCKYHFGRIINTLMATGFFDKWEDELSFDYERLDSLKTKPKDQYAPINSLDLERVFTLSFIGLFICFVVYNAERVIKARPTPLFQNRNSIN